MSSGETCQCFCCSQQVHSVPSETHIVTEDKKEAAFCNVLYYFQMRAPRKYGFLWMQLVTIQGTNWQAHNQTPPVFKLLWLSDGFLPSTVNTEAADLLSMQYEKKRSKFKRTLSHQQLLANVTSTSQHKTWFMLSKLKGSDYYTICFCDPLANIQGNFLTD